MSIKSGVFAAITSVVLILALGNRWALDNASDGGPMPLTMGSVVAFFGWDPDRLFGDAKTAKYVGLVVLVLAAFVLGAAAGRARPLAAFVGGWGAAMGAAAVAGMTFSLVAGDDGANGFGGETLDRAFTAAGAGTQAMILVGWLIGIAVLVGSFGAKQPKVAGAGQPLPPSQAGWGGPPPGYPSGGGYDHGYSAPPASGGYDQGYQQPSAAPAQPAPSAAPVIGPPPDPERTQVLPPYQQ